MAKVVPWKRAVAYAGSRKVTLPDVYYGELRGVARADAFSIAGIASLTQLREILLSLKNAMQQGLTFADWKAYARTHPALTQLPAYRIENIFRTNLQSAYAHGRCVQQQASLRTHPYFLYDAVNDSRTRPAHAAMDGFVAKHDDPVWKTWTPPCGYQCRCRRIALTEAQAKELMADDEVRVGTDRDLYAARQKALRDGPDAGWDYSPCDVPNAGLVKATKKSATTPLAQPPVTKEIKPPPAKADRPRTLQEWVERGAKLREELDKEVGARIGGIPSYSQRQEWKLAFNRRLAKRQGGVTLRTAPAGEAAGSTRTASQTYGDTIACDALRDAAKFYPSDWLAYSNKAGLIRTLGEEGRAWALHNPDIHGFMYEGVWVRPGEALLKVTADTPGITLVHELGHRLQSTVPGLDKYYQQVHTKRTMGTEAKSLRELTGCGYEATEKARPDKYINPYFGRVTTPYVGPRNASTMAEGEAMEMLPMSMQHFAPDAESYDLAYFARNDRELFDLTLSLLLEY